MAEKSVTDSVVVSLSFDAKQREYIFYALEARIEQFNRAAKSARNPAIAHVYNTDVMYLQGLKANFLPN